MHETPPTPNSSGHDSAALAAMAAASPSPSPSPSNAHLMSLQPIRSRLSFSSATSDMQQSVPSDVSMSISMSIEQGSPEPAAASTPVASTPHETQPVFFASQCASDSFAFTPIIDRSAVSENLEPSPAASVSTPQIDIPSRSSVTVNAPADHVAEFPRSPLPRVAALPRHAQALSIVQDKLLNHDLSLFAWCDSMDVLGAVTRDNRLLIHRLSWQRVCTATIEGEPVTALCWRADSKILVLTQRCGSISLYSPETATLFFRFSPTAASAQPGVAPVTFPSFSFLPAFKAPAVTATNTYWNTTHSVLANYPFAHSSAVVCCTWTPIVQLPAQGNGDEPDCSPESLPFSDSFTRGCSFALPRVPVAEDTVYCTTPDSVSEFHPVGPASAPAHAAPGTTPMKPAIGDQAAQLFAQHAHKQSPLHIHMNSIHSNASLDVLATADLDGRLILHAHGTLPIAAFNLHRAFGTASVAILPLSVALSTDLSRITVIANMTSHSSDFSQSSIVTISLSNTIFPTRVHELRSIAHACQLIENRFVYIQRALHVVRYKWTEAHRQFASKFVHAFGSHLSLSGQPRRVADQLYAFAVSGCANAAFRSFISEYIQPQPLNRARVAVEQALSFAIDTVALGIQPAIVQLLSAFSQLRALSQWKERFASCGLNSDELESILTELGCMLKAWKQLHLVLSAARINYLAFFHQLSECVRVFGEAAQESIRAAERDEQAPPRLALRLGTDTCSTATMLQRLDHFLQYDYASPCDRVSVCLQTSSSDSAECFTELDKDSKNALPSLKIALESWKKWLPSITRSVSSSIRVDRVVCWAPSSLNGLKLAADAAASRPSSMLEALYEPSFQSVYLLNDDQRCARLRVRAVSQLPFWRVPEGISADLINVRNNSSSEVSHESAAAIAKPIQKPAAPAVPSLFAFMRPDESDQSMVIDSDVSMDLDASKMSVASEAAPVPVTSNSSSDVFQQPTATVPHCSTPSAASCISHCAVRHFQDADFTLGAFALISPLNLRPVLVLVKHAGTSWSELSIACLSLSSTLPHAEWSAIDFYGAADSLNIVIAMRTELAGPAQSQFIGQVHFVPMEGVEFTALADFGDDLSDYVNQFSERLAEKSEIMPIIPALLACDLLPVQSIASGKIRSFPSALPQAVALSSGRRLGAVFMRNRRLVLLDCDMDEEDSLPEQSMDEINLSQSISADLDASALNTSRPTPSKSPHSLSTSHLSGGRAVTPLADWAQRDRQMSPNNHGNSSSFEGDKENFSPLSHSNVTP